MGDDRHVIFGRKFPGEKEKWTGDLSWCKRQFFLSSKFRADSSHIFK
jgi:hypothetical protein